MLSAMIRASLAQRTLVIAAALAVVVVGIAVTVNMPIDILPSLTRPRVIVLVEAPGLAPEEVETLIALPIESAVNGANGVEVVRSECDIGLAVIYAEFSWSTDIYIARQMVAERLATVADRLPAGISPQLAPISSLLGQIMILGLWSENGATSDQEIRTLADWVVRKRLLAIPGVAQVLTIGGDRLQWHVLVDYHALHAHEVSLHDVEQALQQANLNISGGYVGKVGEEFLIRGLGRVHDLPDIGEIVVKSSPTRSVLIRDIAKVVHGSPWKRGDSFVNGHPSVVLNIQKQPEADTRRLTEAILLAADDLRAALPDDVHLSTDLYQQRSFIDRGIDNVIDAMRDGAILVVIVLALFLVNWRATFITLTAIPLSVVVTTLIFWRMGLTINVMTLGGIAVAMGELVDDAIVGVENVLRRLKENAERTDPKPTLEVVWLASNEVRAPIVYGTAIVILVFLPLFALSGMEGRLFTPLGVAYVISILASLLVSLTVTPALAYYLLPASLKKGHSSDGWVLRGLKGLATPVIRTSMSRLGLSIIVPAFIAMVTASALPIPALGTEFLPPFDEGAVQLNIYLPVGSSLDASREVRELVDRRLGNLVARADEPDQPIKAFTARLGRAEDDEHVMGVQTTEYIIELSPAGISRRQEVIEIIRNSVSDIPGIESEVEQPIAHLISHMLSGVTAEIAIKIYGEDFDVIRRIAGEIKSAIADVPGIAAPVIEAQANIGHYTFELRHDRLADYGLRPAEVLEFLETALNGRVVSKVLDEDRTYDVLLRFADEQRENIPELMRLPIELHGGARISLGEVVEFREDQGLNRIAREKGKRRLAVRVNTTNRDSGSAVQEIRRVIEERVDMPTGVFVEYAGQFEAQASATQRILGLGFASFLGIAVILYSLFGRVSLALQVLIALPAAFVGGVWALALTGQSLSVASLVGFISLGGIATRNGILLIEHYRNLLAEDPNATIDSLILRGSLERLAPVLMTALTTGLGLLPLVIEGGAPGKEILYPVATVIVGGLLTSTLCEFLIRPGMFLRLRTSDDSTV